MLSILFVIIALIPVFYHVDFFTLYKAFSLSVYIRGFFLKQDTPMDSQNSISWILGHPFSAYLIGIPFPIPSENHQFCNTTRIWMIGNRGCSTFSLQDISARHKVTKICISFLPTRKKESEYIWQDPKRKRN